MRVRGLKHEKKERLTIFTQDFAGIFFGIPCVFEKLLYFAPEIPCWGCRGWVNNPESTGATTEFLYISTSLIKAECISFVSIR